MKKVIMFLSVPFFLSITACGDLFDSSCDCYVEGPWKSNTCVNTGDVVDDSEGYRRCLSCYDYTKEDVCECNPKSWTYKNLCQDNLFKIKVKAPSHVVTLSPLVTVNVYHNQRPGIEIQTFEKLISSPEWVIKEYNGSTQFTKFKFNEVSASVYINDPDRECVVTPEVIKIHQNQEPEFTVSCTDLPIGVNTINSQCPRYVRDADYACEFLIDHAFRGEYAEFFLGEAGVPQTVDLMDRFKRDIRYKYKLVIQELDGTIVDSDIDEATGDDPIAFLKVSKNLGVGVYRVTVFKQNPTLSFVEGLKVGLQEARCIGGREKVCELSPNRERVSRLLTEGGWETDSDKSAFFAETADYRAGYMRGLGPYSSLIGAVYDDYGDEIPTKFTAYERGDYDDAYDYYLSGVDHSYAFVCPLPPDDDDLRDYIRTMEYLPDEVPENLPLGVFYRTLNNTCEAARIGERPVPNSREEVIKGHFQDAWEVLMDESTSEPLQFEVIVGPKDTNNPDTYANEDKITEFTRDYIWNPDIRLDKKKYPNWKPIWFVKGSKLPQEISTYPVTHGWRYAGGGGLHRSLDTGKFGSLNDKEPFYTVCPAELQVRSVTVCPTDSGAGCITACGNTVTYACWNKPGELDETKPYVKYRFCHIVNGNDTGYTELPNYSSLPPGTDLGKKETIGLSNGNGSGISGPHLHIEGYHNGSLTPINCIDADNIEVDPNCERDSMYPINYGRIW